MVTRIFNFLFHNTSLRQTVIKNTFWLTAGQILNRAIRAIIVIYAARVMGASQFGILTYAIGFAGLFAVFNDLGLEPLIAREIAKNVTPREKILSAGLYLKGILVVVSYVALLILGNKFSSIPESRILLPLLGFSIFLDTLKQLGMMILNGMERMEINTFINILHNSATVLAGIIALIIAPTPFSLAVAYIIGSAVGFGATFYYLRIMAWQALSSFDRSVAYGLIKDAVPFILVSLVGIGLTNIDTVMIGWLSVPQDVGYYNAALKIVQLLFTLPAIISWAIFPVISKRAADKTNSGGVLQKSLNVMNMVGLPLAIGGILIAPALIQLVYGAGYASASLSLQVLMLAVIFNYPATILNYAIIAHNAQAKLAPFLIVTAITNIVLNYLFILHWGFIGSAWATVLAQLITTFGSYYLIHRFESITVVRPILRVLGATGSMAVVIFLLQKITASPFILIPAGGIVYLSLLLFLREPLFLEILTTLKLKRPSVA